MTECKTLALGESSPVKTRLSDPLSSQRRLQPWT